ATQPSAAATNAGVQTQTAPSTTARPSTTPAGRASTRAHARGTHPTSTPAHTGSANARPERTPHPTATTPAPHPAAAPPRPAPQTKATPHPTPPAPAQTLDHLAANPSGMLMFSTRSLSARAGRVRIAFTNMAPLAHNLTVATASGAVIG